MRKCRKAFGYIIFNKRNFNDGIKMRQIEMDANKLSSNPVTFRQMTNFGSILFNNNNNNKLSNYNIEKLLIQSCEYCRQELKYRIAKSILCIKNLPYGVLNSDIIREIEENYITTYNEVSLYDEIKSITDETIFTNALKNMLKRHTYTVSKLSLGLNEMELNDDKFNIIDYPYLNEFLDSFVTIRLGTRVIAGHQVSLHDSYFNNNKDLTNFKGIFDDNCDILERIEQAIDDATIKCLNKYNISPNVNITDKRQYKHKKFTYISEHIHHMVFELLKNSMRAVTEFHHNNASELPSINIIICDNDDGAGLQLKISDKGGGIPRKELNNIWLYSYTTSFKNVSINDKINTLNKYRDLIYNNIDTNTELPYKNRKVLGGLTELPMHGIGNGLASCLCYSKYFGGDCNVYTVHGYGTDAYLFLKNLSSIDQPV